MASLASLPSELLTIICGEVYPNIPPYSSRVGLRTLAALALTNRRLSSVANPILYHRGVHFHHHRPLAWAAKRNDLGTLERALAAGASPNHLFETMVDLEAWNYAMATHQADAAWETGDLEYWPSAGSMPEPRDRSAMRREARTLTPTLTQFDVLYPTMTQLDILEEDDSGQDESDSDYGYDDTTGFGFLDHGPPARDRKRRTYTALHIAAREGHNKVVNALLDRGADIGMSSRNFCRCHIQGLSLWESHLKHLDSNVRVVLPLGVWPPLHVAICSSRIQTAKLLVSRGSPLITHTVSKHLSGGIEEDYEALHHAAASGHVAILEHILAICPNLDIDRPYNETGPTALYCAIANRRWDTTVPWLLERGADINRIIRVPWEDEVLLTTALGEACRLGHFDVAMKLLDLGADITVGARLETDEADFGNIQLHIPLLYLCCVDSANYDRCFPPTRFSHLRENEPQRFSCRDVMARLFAAGVSPDMKWDIDVDEECPETPLSMAVQHIHVPAVRALLKAGADVNARDRLGRNALMLAVGHVNAFPSWRSDGIIEFDWGFVPCDDWRMPFPNDFPNRRDVVKLLLEGGIRVDHQDSDGNTALHHLFVGQSTKYMWIESKTLTEILLVLLARGADPYIRNKLGQTAFLFAVRYQCLYALEIILKKCPPETFSLQEFVTILMEARREDGDDLGPLNDDEDGLSPEKRSDRIVELLLEMDTSGLVLFQPAFIRACLSSEWKRSPVTEIAELLCHHGLENATLDPELKLEVLWRVIQDGRWDIADQLVESGGFDINAVHSGRQTLLGLALEEYVDEDFILRLVDAGANVHQPISTSMEAMRGITEVTGLKMIIARRSISIAGILLKQPIRGNPQASVPLYLHYVITRVTTDPLPRMSGIYPFWWKQWAKPLRALIAAGADLTQEDDDGNTPMSFLLKLMVADTEGELVKNIGHWLKPLSRGVDINKKSKEGKSAVDYIEQLMGKGDTAKAMSKNLRIFTKDAGKKEISWLM